MKATIRIAVLRLQLQVALTLCGGNFSVILFFRTNFGLLVAL